MLDSLLKVLLESISLENVAAGVVVLVAVVLVASTLVAGSQPTTDIATNNITPEPWTISPQPGSWISYLPMGLFVSLLVIIFLLFLVIYLCGKIWMMKDDQEMLDQQSNELRESERREMIALQRQVNVLRGMLGQNVPSDSRYIPEIIDNNVTVINETTAEVPGSPKLSPGKKDF